MVQWCIGADGKTIDINVSFLRVLRLMKVVRILRIVRLMKQFFELRLILASILGSVKACVWSLMLIFAISYIVGLCLLQSATTYLKEQKVVSPEVESDIDEYWSTSAKCMQSLYMSTTGGKDWYEVAKVLQEIGWAAYGVFLVYIGFFFCVVTNTLTSLFVEATRINAANDHEWIIHDALDRKDEYIKNLKAWYSKIDTDNSGDVTLKELSGHLNDPCVLEFAKILDIEVLDVRQFFIMLSGNGSKTVDLETFVVGCIKLKGLARSMDLLDLLHTCKDNMNDLQDSIRDLQNMCGHEFKTLRCRVGLSPAMSWHSSLLRRSAQA
jgi:hypothetical protein